ncbi:ATP-dependent RecD-like DNA helicase [Eubacterium sp.]|jgi:exodeoxyribonuclease V alpha subunit|uniref:SF1B family DNA helicase RecD2 n=1 Tax=Eubacterium sp. TaxID=142586 RepID=UPI001DD8C5B7|nr:ATP-dependent RecD-like DNA helicase [Eubacterium sp.]MBS5620043.1 ATP-dependent RecD-like DNA helicase [Eubacterium sp.]
MKSLSGYVESITFRNEENGYTVLTLSYGKKEIKCTGNFGYISEGEYLEIEGEEVFHDIYGEQIKVTSYKVIPATDELSLKKYLGSGAIKGLGAVLANRIVDKFGEDTLRIVEEEPERLAEIRGITIRKAMDICEQVEEKKDMRDVMIFLQGYGISPTLSNKIYTMYGQKVYDIIKTNPYKLADDLSGIGFKTADEIARRAGVEVNASIRIKSGMCYALSDASLSGHTYLPKEKLVEKTINLLGLRDQYLNADGTYNMDLLDNCFTELVLEKKLILKNIEEKDAVFLSTYYYTELNIARMLLELNISTPEDDYIMGVKLDTIEKLSGVELDDLQRKAVIETQNNGITIITGGPGTGKTTTINAIIQMFEADGLEVSLAAPTGRAAKRMNEATGHEAKTIHRLLEISGGASEETGRDEIDAKFGRNEQNPLETDVIIVDEMSMVDTFLVHALLKAITIGTRVVFVGDINQLASVGPGNVLRDIIESEQFSVVRLTKVFRQAGESGIVTNAHKINKGEQVTLDNSMGDFLYIERENAQMALNATIGLMMSKLPQYVEAKPMDIQVLTPMRGGILGVNSLNEQLQKYINPQDENKREREIAGIIFREGDKVMQIKNNYQLEWEQRSEGGRIYDSGTGIFNGDMGIITTINNTTNTMEVVFDDDRYVIYDSKQAEELELAYAITIHKSQGSEYPAVIMPLVSGVSMLMTRNLLYTGVTRAKKCVCIVGRKETFSAMIANEDQHRRYSGLKWQLVNYYNEEQ